MFYSVRLVSFGTICQYWPCQLYFCLLLTLSPVHHTDIGCWHCHLSTILTSDVDTVTCPPYWHLMLTLSPVHHIDISHLMLTLSPVHHIDIWCWHCHLSTILTSDVDTVTCPPYIATYLLTSCISLYSILYTSHQYHCHSVTCIYSHISTILLNDWWGSHHLSIILLLLYLMLKVTLFLPKNDSLIHPGYMVIHTHTHLMPFSVLMYLSDLFYHIVESVNYNLLTVDTLGHLL